MTRKHCSVETFRGTLPTGSCGEPATVKWEWPGSSKPLYVCDHHDQKIQGDNWGKRTEIRGEDSA